MKFPGVSWLVYEAATTSSQVQNVQRTVEQIVVDKTSEAISQIMEKKFGGT